MMLKCLKSPKRITVLKADLRSSRLGNVARHPYIQIYVAGESRMAFRRPTLHSNDPQIAIKRRGWLKV